MIFLGRKVKMPKIKYKIPIRINSLNKPIIPTKVENIPMIRLRIKKITEENFPITEGSFLASFFIYKSGRISF